MIDFHSHILPGIDDGSKGRDMSMAMLTQSQKDGVDVMVATPHFYINIEKDICKFLDKREGSFNALTERIAEDKADVPKIIKGAEVFYFRGIAAYDDLEKLQIENTNYLLLELPFERWNDRVFKDIDDIVDRGIIPIIAHINRYLYFQKGTNNVERLIKTKLPIQMNAEFVNDFFTRRQALRLINDGVVKLLGSDCHNMDKRKPNLGKCMDIVKKRLGDNIVNDIDSFGRSILNI